MIASRVKDLLGRLRRKRCPECGRPVRETFCDVCGYDLVQQARDEALKRRIG